MSGFGKDDQNMGVRIRAKLAPISQQRQTADKMMENPVVLALVLRGKMRRALGMSSAVADSDTR